MEAGRISRPLPGLAVGLAALLLSAPAASAAPSIAPTSHNFGSHEIGTTSGPQTFTVTAGCATFLGPPFDTCLVPDVVLVAPAVTPDAHYTFVNGCAPLLVGPSSSCQINVRFKPAGEGTKNATLSAGSGLAAALTGVATNPPGTQSGQGGSGGDGKKAKCSKGFKKKKIKRKGKKKAVVKCVKAKKCKKGFKKKKIKRKGKKKAVVKCIKKKRR